MHISKYHATHFIYETFIQLHYNGCASHPDPQTAKAGEWQVCGQCRLQRITLSFFFQKKKVF